MAIKIDMCKAYDKVEWPLVINMIEKCGFNNNWTKWILDCMSLLSYKILINGSLGPQSKPLRGLKQGNPISLFIFLLYSKGLSASLVSKERNRFLFRI